MSHLVQTSVENNTEYNQVRPNINRPMTVKEFNTMKKDITKLLRSKGDDFPVCNVQNGCNSVPEAYMKMQLALDMPSQTSRLTRGYKLVVITDHRDLYTYAAQPYVALKQADGSIVSFIKDERFGDTPFIFVPSSKMHPEISDAKILSCNWKLATVVSGNSLILDMLVRVKQNMSIIERQKFAFAPENAVAAPVVRIRFFPFFKEFVESNPHAFDNPNDAALCFGMPYQNIKDDKTSKNSRDTFIWGKTDDAMDFLEPTSSWLIDTVAWLPSVSKLHATMNAIYIKRNVPKALHYKLLISIYEKLGHEYKSRLKQSGQRVADEHRMLRTEFC